MVTCGLERLRQEKGQTLIRWSRLTGPFNLLLEFTTLASPCHHLQSKEAWKMMTVLPHLFILFLFLHLCLGEM